jgi:Mlc titration factor MtfA (ptsG expression regulator)
MIELNWDDFYHKPVTFAPDRKLLQMGTLTIFQEEILDFGASIGTVKAQALGEAAWKIHTITVGSCQPQLATLVFTVLRRTQALNTYFPLTNILSHAEQQDFYRLASHIMKQSGFNVQLIGEHGANLTDKMVEVAFFVACHIAEIFFYRRDILERLLKTNFQVRLYTTASAFKYEGGAAGGNYSPDKKGIQLVLSRLYEGFNGKTPGVAPFLHEFGHLLDHFDGAGRLAKSRGTLPGMRPDEGSIFIPQARDLFLKGKQLELDRYMHLHQNGYRSGDPFPIGGPYVFQNDTEFIAGYFEMFFRNPHYFAAQNPNLYDSFVLTFGYDPRKAWAADFPFYIEQNQTFYRTQRPPRPGLSI